MDYFDGDHMVEYWYTMHAVTFRAVDTQMKSMHK